MIKLEDILALRVRHWEQWLGASAGEKSKILRRIQSGITEIIRQPKNLREQYADCRGKVEKRRSCRVERRRSRHASPYHGTVQVFP